MSKSLFLILAFSSLTLISGCASSIKDKNCKLVDIAFNETNELAPDWYKEALSNLKLCGIEYNQDTLIERGKL